MCDQDVAKGIGTLHGRGRDTIALEIAVVNTTKRSSMRQRMCDQEGAAYNDQRRRTRPEHFRAMELGSPSSSAFAASGTEPDSAEPSRYGCW